MTYDQWLTALCIWREARGCSPEAMRGVLHVILNRVRDPRWPNSPAAVVLQPRQFSSFLAGDPNCSRFPLPKDRADWQAWETILGLVLSPGDDPTGGANCYESCPDDKEPSWAEDVIARIGPFEFYRN